MKSSNPIKKEKNDKFYTKNEIVDYLLQFIDLSKFEIIIEPSAGNGSFSKKIKRCIALDLEPEGEKIIKQDFLEYIYDKDIDRKYVLVIGNPPFGKQCSLALKFLKKSISFADHIAFILPRSFKKESVQNKIDKNYFLNFEIDVPSNAFTLGGKDYDVPSVFQYWKNGYKVRERENIINCDKWYVYVKDKSIADLAIRRVGIYAGDCFDNIFEKSMASHYFIKLKEKKNIKQLMEYINNIEWKHNNTVGPPSISKNELNKKIISFFS